MPPLVAACLTRNTNETLIAIALLGCGADPNRRDSEYGMCALHAAIWGLLGPMVGMGNSVYLSTVELLCDHDADLNARRPDGATPLMLAAQMGFRAVVEILLERGADARLTDNRGQNAGNWATRTYGMANSKLALLLFDRAK